MNKLKPQRVRTSIRVLQFIMIGLTLAVLGRLFQLQILNYDTYNPLSQENALRQQVVNPARGLIFDRNGKLLVDNVPIYTITITPNKFDTSTIGLLAELMHSDPNDIRERVKKARSYSWHRPSRLITEVDFEVFTKIEENIWRLPGIGHIIESKRNYPYTDLNASHLFGYLSEVNESQYKESNTYRLGDKAGKTGLEEVYEDYLRGESGFSYIRVNALGQPLGTYNDGELDVAPVKGADLYTTIDIDLQLLAEDLIKNKSGAALVIDPNTGEILTFVSSPGYDLKKLAGRIDPDYWREINQDTLRPLFNRAVSAIQPPGSTFKPEMGLISMKMGLITPESIIHNPGYFYRGRKYNDLAPPGDYKLSEAITMSSNTFFFSNMNRIASNDRLNEWAGLASDFGFGKRTGVDIPDEKPGILPDSSYFNKAYGKRWGIGDLLSLGIGQGALSVTPMQMSVVVCALANGGYKVTPHIVKKIQPATSDALYRSFTPKKIDWVTRENLDVIKQGMIGVVERGSARRSKVNELKIAGKTGTAQNPHGSDHGWFIGYAPADDPKVAVVVFIENKGYASWFAAPIGSTLIQQHLLGKIVRKDLYRFLQTTFMSSDEAMGRN